VNAGRLVLIPAATVFIGSRSWIGLRSMSKFGDLSYDLVADAFCCFLKREAPPSILARREIIDLLS
jgi:hypothetical protein